MAMAKLHPFFLKKLKIGSMIHSYNQIKYKSFLSLGNGGRNFFGSSIIIINELHIITTRLRNLNVTAWWKKVNLPYP